MTGKSMVKLTIDQFIETYGYKGPSDILRTLVEHGVKMNYQETERPYKRDCN